MIPYGRQQIDQADLDAVREVLTSDFLTQGPKVPAFETRLADVTGAKHAVVSNSATSSLHVACLALGLGPGDLLWTAPNTFVASANCGLYCGADVDFVDIDPATYNMCAKKLADKLKTAKTAGRLPKIVIPVHMCGQSCDMQAIHTLAREYGFRVIEDASHAIGASYDAAPVGDCRFSDVAVFSFHPVKIITTAEGGGATTNDPDIAARMAYLRSHGVTRDPDLMGAADAPAWYYEQIALGYNYRMTDVHAALGISQLDKLSGFIDQRRALADRYDDRLAGFALDRPARLALAQSSWHLYVIQLHDPARRRAVFDSLRADGIGVNVHYIPVHTQPHYRALGFKPGDFPVAEAYYARAISLPLFAGMSLAQQDTVIDALASALDRAGAAA